MSCVLKELLDKDPDRPVFSLFLNVLNTSNRNALTEKRFSKARCHCPAEKTGE
jgi:hypothetical protein